MFFDIKAAIGSPSAKVFIFTAQRTMYSGKLVATGDQIFVFAREKEVGRLDSNGGGDFCRAGREDSWHRPANAAGEYHRKTAAFREAAHGRTELKPFSDWGDDQPATELNFKLCRQASNKIVEISDAAAAYLLDYF